MVRNGIRKWGWQGSCFQQVCMYLVLLFDSRIFCAGHSIAVTRNLQHLTMTVASSVRALSPLLQILINSHPPNRHIRKFLIHQTSAAHVHREEIMNYAPVLSQRIFHVSEVSCDA